MSKYFDPRGMSEADIMNIFQEILTQPGPLSKLDLEDIDALDRELAHRRVRQRIRIVGGAAFKGIELIS